MTKIKGFTVHNRLTIVTGEAVQSYAMVKHCAAEFVKAEQALKISHSWDVHPNLSGRKLDNFVIQCRRPVIANTVGMNNGSVKMILHEHLMTEVDGYMNA